MKLLLTGGAGFIGSCFTRMAVSGELNLELSDITVLDALTYSGNLKNLDTALNEVEFINGNICDSKLVEKLVEKNDVIINFAAESHVDRSIESSKEFATTNFMGVQVLCDAIKKYGINRYIQISTDEVYGSVKNGYSKETDVLEPNSPYSATKASADLLIYSYINTYKLPIIITRSSNNYGPYQNYEKLIPTVISSLSNNRKIPIYGNGQNLRNWIHVRDNCSAISKLVSQGESGEIYNISGKTEISNLDLVKIILTYMDRDESCIEFVQDRKGHDFRYAIDNSKLIKKIGQQSEIDFMQGLKETIDWYLANQEWLVKNYY